MKCVIILGLAISMSQAVEQEGDDPLDWLRTSVPGEPGLDYPIYSTTQATSFSCSGLVFGGYYADPELQCQSFHVCLQDPIDSSLYPTSFLCPNGTIFDQSTYICDWWFNVDCSISESLYPAVEGAFGSFGELDVGQCPAPSLSGSDCVGSVSNCWSPGQRDTDYPFNGLCCFDGCSDTCVDGPKPVPQTTGRPRPQTTGRPRPQTTRRPRPQTTRRPRPQTTPRPRPQTTQRHRPQTTLRPRPQTTRRPRPQTTRKPRPQTTRRPRPQTTKRPGPQTTRIPQPQTTRQPFPQTTVRPRPQTTKRPRPIEPVVAETETDVKPGTAVTTYRPVFTSPSGYSYPVPSKEDQLTIFRPSTPAPGLPTLYGPPSPGRRGRGKK